MAVISNAALTVVVDKLARYAGEFVTGAEAAADSVLSGVGALDAYILDTDDVDVVADLLPAARDLDETHPNPADSSLLAISGFAAMIAGLNAHLVRYGSAAGLDAYLTALNLSTPTLRVHGDFRKYLATVSAKNTFIPDDLVLATFAATGAATGTFTDITAILTSKYAGAKLVVKNQGAVTTGATLSVTGKKLDNSTAIITATIATGTDNFETDLSVTTKLFVDVTLITISGATNGNVYEIVAKTDRSVAAA